MSLKKKKRKGKKIPLRKVHIHGTNTGSAQELRKMSVGYGQRHYYHIICCILKVVSALRSLGFSTESLVYSAAPLPLTHSKN